LKIIFPLIALSVISLIAAYPFVRGLQAFSYSRWLSVGYASIYIFAFLAFMLKMFIGETTSSSISLFLSRVGFTWFIAVIYFFLFALSFDLLRLINHFTGFFPPFIKENYQLVKLILAVFVGLFVSSLLIYGNWKFNHPVVRELSINIDKPLPPEGVNIVLASDIHLSTIINRDKLTQYVTLINRQNPDLVLIAGDISDRNIKPLIDGKLSELLGNITSTYGTYAVTGNHEYYGGDKEALYSYYRSSGIHLLIDSVVVVNVGDGILNIIGRDDKTNHHRKSLGMLIEGVDKKWPVILMDHQPYNLQEAELAGVDLQVSGHTHQGQFWPGSLLVKKMYELSYGYKVRGKTHYVVSSGLGLWGPEFRIGTSSEIVLIHLFSKS
jgi:hypothetical protein